MIINAIKNLTYFIYPRRCDLCGEVICLDEVRCEECINASKTSEDACLKCGHDTDSCDCKKTNKKPPYKAIIAPYYFEDSIAFAVHRFKFHGYKELSKGMAKEIASLVNRRYKDVKFDIVTFVPMTRKENYKRGYNQSYLLAKAVSKELNIPLEKSLTKIRNTDNQRGKSAKDRKTNLYGAFDLTKGMSVENKTILLIDDVKTTGSTFFECTEMLKAYGAADVYCAAFALTRKQK